MKMGLPVIHKNKSAKISHLFARSEYFAIIDKTNKTYEIIENPYFKMDAGIGQSVTELLLSHDVRAFIGYEIGLNMQQIAKKQKIQLIVIKPNFTKLEQVLELIKIK